jgi:hypothetical protein
MDLPDYAVREHAAAVALELMFQRNGMLNQSWSQWTMSEQDSAGQVIFAFSLADFCDISP